MSIFGWSYPPGCNGTPFDMDYPCEICQEFEDKCECPECPQCGEIGNLKCEGHGLDLSAQKEKGKVVLENLRKLNELEIKAYEDERRDQESFD